nr:unnamed protein product [Callosobruchus chinensis]
MDWSRAVKIGVFLAIIALDDAIASKKPNIILIVGDDEGWNDFGFHGSSQIPTPNIDALAYNGVILDKFYTQQTCTPSRAALLTGVYPFRYGFQGTPISAGENRSLPLNIPTMAEQLKKLGYSTHLVGKWHLGAAYKKVTPTRRGFDSHFGYWAGFVGYFDYMAFSEVTNTTNYTGFDLHHNFEPLWKYQGQYATDLFTKKSLNIIDKHNKDEPLFLLLAHLAAHTGKNGTELGVPNITEADEKYKYIDRKERRQYAEVVKKMDDSIGEIVQKLSDRKMLENSIIIFFSDNGAQTEGLYQNFASGWPLRGLKFTLFEGGVRGSCVAYSPLFQKQGYVNTDLMHITDWLPTLYHAAGGDVSKLGKIDGINQWDVLSRNIPTNRSEILLNIDEVENHSGVLGYNGRYKLINGTLKHGVYDSYYGDSGRNGNEPEYDFQAVLKSPTHVAIQKLGGKIHIDEQSMRHTKEQVDRSSCRDKSYTPKISCQEFCLFDIDQDPCETSNVLGDRDKQDIVDVLKNKLTGYYQALTPQLNREVDVNSYPSRFNNTWSTWLDYQEHKFGILNVLPYLYKALLYK